MQPEVEGDTGHAHGSERRWCGGSPPRRSELLGNLLDNAWKWAQSRIHLTVANEAQATIVVEDDGAGIDDAEFERLLRRGIRQDEDIPGHGIGLSIVKGLVDELGGSLALSRSDTLGGLKVTVRLENKRGDTVR